VTPLAISHRNIHAAEVLRGCVSLCRDMTSYRSSGQHRNANPESTAGVLAAKRFVLADAFVVVDDVTAAVQDRRGLLDHPDMSCAPDDAGEIIQRSGAQSSRRKSLLAGRVAKSTGQSAQHTH